MSNILNNENSDFNINQNTKPVDVNKLIQQVQSNDPSLLNYNISSATTQSGEEAFMKDRIFNEEYEKFQKELEKEVVKEEYDTFVGGLGKLIGNTATTAVSMGLDIIGFIDPADWRLPTFGGSIDALTGLFGAKTNAADYLGWVDPFAYLNKGFEALDNYTILGDGDVTGNGWTRAAQSAREYANHYFQVNWGKEGSAMDYLDWGFNTTAMIAGNGLGMVIPGAAIAKAGQLAKLGQTSNALFNAFVMTESTGLSIAQDVHDKVYGEVLNKLSDGKLKQAEDKAFQEAYQKVINEGGSVKDAQWAAMQSTKQARNEFALANPELGKEASKNAGYGADIALKGMAPIFALNLITANAFTRTLYNPRNILSAPSRISGKEFAKEAFTEGLEEGLLEKQAEQIGVSYGTKGEYNAKDLSSIVWDYEKDTWNWNNLYEGAIGALSGGVMSGFRDVMDYGARKEDYQKQQEVIQQQNKISDFSNVTDSAGIRKIVDDATTLTKTLESVTKLANEASILETQGKKQEANLIKSKLLGVQAFQAFESGTTENLIKNYENIASNPLATPDIKTRAKEALVEIQQMEEVYKDTRGKYLNGQQVYSSKINQLTIDKAEKELETNIIQKRLEADAAIKLELESGKVSLTSKETPIVDESGKVIDTKKEQLSYNITNLKRNPYAYNNDKDSEIYRAFSEHVTNNVQAVRELNDLEQRLDEVQTLKKQNNDYYNEITSKPFQKSLGFENKLGKEVNKKSKELEEKKGTDEFMPFVEGIMSKYKGKISDKAYSAIKEDFEKQNERKKSSIKKEKDNSVKEQFTTSKTGTEPKTEAEKVTEKENTAKPEGAKAMVETIARKLAANPEMGNKALTKEEQTFYMNNSTAVEKRRTEITSSEGNQAQDELTEDEETSTELSESSANLSNLINSTEANKEKGKEEKPKPLSNAKVEEALNTTETTSNIDKQIQKLEEERKEAHNQVENIGIKGSGHKTEKEAHKYIDELYDKQIAELKAKQQPESKQETKPTLSTKQKEILSNFKNGKVAKALLNRKFADSKSDIQALIDNGTIKEEGNNYVLTGLEAKPVTITVTKTKAEQVADNLLSKEFSRDPEGNFTLEINLKDKTDEQKKELIDAYKVIKERIDNNQLSGWSASLMDNPIISAITITRPNLNTVNSNESLSPKEVPSDLTKEEEQNIKDAVLDYAETMEIDNGKFPTFEEFIKSFIKTAGKKQAEKGLKLLGRGWELNGYGKIDNYPYLISKYFTDIMSVSGRVQNVLGSIFESREDESKKVGIQEEPLPEDFTNPEPQTIIKQEEQLKQDEIANNRVPVDVTPDNEIVYSTQSAAVSETSLKLGGAVFDVYTERQIEGRTITTDTFNKGLKNETGLVKAIKLANFENIKPGTHLEIANLSDNFLDTLLIPKYVEDKNDVRYQLEELTPEKKVATIKFGEWVEEKAAAANMTVEEFRNTDEYWSRVPILVRSVENDGNYIAQVHDEYWYNGTKFVGDVKEAKKNVREARAAIKKAHQQGKSIGIVITQITGNQYTQVKADEAMLVDKANPDALVGMIVKNKEGKFVTVVYDKDGKMINNIEIDNIPMFTENEDNKNKSAIPINVRRWGTDADGKPTYKAFYSISPNLNESQVNTVANLLYTGIITSSNQKVEDVSKFVKAVDTIKNTAKSDLGNDKSFFNLLKRYVYIKFITKDDISLSLLNEVSELINKNNVTPADITSAENKLTPAIKILLGNSQSGIFALGKLNTIVVAEKTGQTVTVKIINKNNVTATNNQINKTDEFTERDELLKRVLGNSLLNTFTSVNDFGNPVIELNDNFEINTVANNYTEFIKPQMMTTVKSVNVGTEDNPVYATRLQANVYYELTEAKEGKNFSRKQDKITVTNSKVTPKDEQKITNVVESTSDESFQDAVKKVEQDGFDLLGDTVEEKAEDLKGVVKQMNNDSKEIVDNHLTPTPTLDDINSYNEFINQALNQVRWVNDYLNLDNEERSESLQPKEITEEQVKEMNVNLMKIEGINSKHQYELANYVNIKLTEALVEGEKINEQEIRNKVEEELNKLLGANKEIIEENLEKLKSIPQYEDRPQIVALIAKHNIALNKIDLVLENTEVIYLQAKALVIKDLNGKIVKNKVEDENGKVTITEEIQTNNDVDETLNDDEEGENDDFAENPEDAAQLGTEDYSKTSLEVNPKSSITSTLRRFMRGIPNINSKTGLPKTGAMGATTYVDFDTVYDVTQSILADAPVDFQAMMDILELNKDRQPWIPELINKLKESNNEIKNQFTTTMGKHALSMKLLMYSFDSSGNVSFTIVNTNQSSITNKLSKDWKNNFETVSPLINENGEIQLGVVDELILEYNSWFESPASLRVKDSVIVAKDLIKRGVTSFTPSTTNENKLFEELNKGENKSKIIAVEDKGITTEYKFSIVDGKITISQYQRNPVSAAILNYDNPKLTTEQKREALDKIQEWFGAFGIELNDASTEKLLRGTYKGKESIKASTYFSSSNNYSVGVLYKWLKSAQNGVVKVVNETNNPLDNSAINKDLAFHQSKYSSGIVTSAFRDGKKNIYGYTAFKYITDRFNELRKQEELRNNLRQLSFSKNSFWLKLFEDGSVLPGWNFKERFNVIHLGLNAIKEFNKKLYRDNGITDLGDVDHELVKVGLHQVDRSKISKTYTIGDQEVSLRNISTLFPTMSDKSTMTITETYGLKLTDKRYYDKTESGKLVPNKNIANFIFEQAVLPEIERVVKFVNEVKNTDIKGYKDGAKMLLFMPHLNNLVIAKTADGKDITLNDAITFQDPDNDSKVDLQKVLANKDVILTEIQNYISALHDEKMAVWKKNNYYTVEEGEDGVNKVTTRLLDKNYMKEIVADNDLQKVEIAAMDFEINQLIANVNSFMTVIGDPAVYYKSKPSESFIKQSKETFTNVGKRLAAMIAPGSKIANSENEQYTQIFLEDRVAMSENIDFLTELLDNKKFDRDEYNRILNLDTKSDDPIKAKELEDKKKKELEAFYNKYPNSKDYFEIEGTDAQEYTTWQEHLHILEKLGRLSDATSRITPEEIREARVMFSQNIPIDEMSEAQKGILKKVLQPIKPVYTGQIFDAKQDTMRMMYIKSSSFPLLPQLTEGLEIDKLRTSLENLQKKGNSYQYVRASYQTANKVGAKSKALSLYNGDGTIKDITEAELEDASLTLNRKDFKIQLDVPFKSFKKKEDTVSLMTQLNKILFGNGVMEANGFNYNGKLISGAELQKIYTNTFIELNNLKRQELYDELGIDINTNKPIDVDKTATKLQKILRDEAVSRGYSKQDIESLEIKVAQLKDGTKQIRFKMPVWLSANSNRFENLLNAIVNNRIVKMKFPGSSFVAGSEEGFKFQTDFKGVDKSKIVWTSKWNNDSLQAAKYDKDGNLQYAQVIAPSKFRKKDGTLIDLLETRDGKEDYIYVTKTPTGFRLKEDMIDPELRNFTSARIPTSGHMSGPQIEIVGFLPAEQGDLMIVPRNLTKQKGLDFDVDKENTYQLWHETDENGRITPLKKGSKEKMLQNEIIRITSAVFSNPSKEVQKIINNVLSIEYAKKQAEQIDNWISQTKDDKYFTPLSSEYQKNKMFLGASGKIGIGAYSLDVTTHSLFEQAKANGSQLSLNFVKVAKDGTPIPVNFYMQFGEGGHLSNGLLGKSRTLDGERTIAQVLSELQNIATDNEKEQVMGRVNLNSYTLDVSKILAMLGFDKDKNGNSIQFTFLSQPILREYAKEMADANANVAEFTLDKEGKVIRKLLEKYGNLKYELGFEQDGKNTELFSMDNMESNLKGSVDNNFQLAVLNRFLELKKLGLVVRTLQGAINTDSKGLGKSILDNAQKIESINNLLKNKSINGVSALLGDFKRREDLSISEEESLIKEGYLPFGESLFKPTTINGVFTANALVTASSLWDDYFPYNSEVFNTIFDTLMPLISKSEASDAKKVEKKVLIIKEMKKYLNSYAATESLFENTDAQAERERLFFDRPGTAKISLATYIKNLKKSNSSIANNTLLERLQTVIAIDNTPSVIKFNNTSSGFYDEDAINNALFDLLESNITLPLFNGEPYSSRKLAQDLVTYAYLEGGVQEATQFVKFIPLSYLEAMGFTTQMSSIDFNSTDGLAKFNNFITQFAQHNPSIMPKLDNIIPADSDVLVKFDNFTIKEALYIEEDDALVPDSPPFLSLRHEGEYFLWERDMEGRYHRISTLGQSDMVEYDPKSDNVVSLSQPLPPTNPVENPENAQSIPTQESKMVNELRFGLNSNASLRDIIEQISNSPSVDEYLVNLAKQLLPAINEETTIKVEDIDSKGSFNRDTNVITINTKQARDESDTELARTILKELTHSITDNELVKYVYKDENGNRYLKTSDAPPHIQSLVKLFNQVAKLPDFERQYQDIVERLSKKGEDRKLTPKQARIYYGGYNILEFVEMMMTQPEFQQEMSKIKTQSGKSVLDLFKDFIGKLFKHLGVTFESDTIAAEAIDSILTIVKEKSKPVIQQQTQLVSDNTFTPIEGLNERLNAYGYAKVVLPSNFYEGERPKGRLNAFKDIIIQVSDNIMTLANLNLSEFDFLTTEDKARLDALKPLAKELSKINTSDISLASRRTVAVEKRFAQLSNQLVNEFVDIVGKYVEEQLGKKITSSKPKLNITQQTQPVNTQVEQIYFNINTNNLTQSKNIILPKDLQENTKYTGKNFWDKIVPEAKSMYDKKDVFGKPMLIAFRGNSKKTFLQNYKDGNTIGNPFNWQDEKGNAKEQGITSTKKFIEWMITGNNFGNKDATEEYRQAIINDIKSGEIKGSSILYYEEKGYATHATALDYLINQYNWNTVSTQTQPTKIDSNNKINIYAGTGENVELSNFAIRPTTYNTAYVEGFFRTPEGAFQAAKIAYTKNLTEEQRIHNAMIFEKLKSASGSEAKALGKTIKGLDVENWNRDSSDVMLYILLDSFQQNPKALAKLLATGNATLTHTQDKGKWGTEFPRLLMEVRDELRSTQPTTPVSNPVKNDLIKVLEEIKKDLDENSDNLDFPDISASEFSGYPNIQKYLNSEYGMEKREYDFFSANKDVVEDLLSGLEGVTANNLLDMLNSITNKQDIGLTGDVKPIITNDTKKDENAINKANKALKGTIYELFPGVYANEQQTEALDKLNKFINTPRDASEKRQSTFVLTGRGGTGKTTIVKKIIDIANEKSKEDKTGKKVKVVGGAISHVAKNNLKASLKGKDVRTIASLTGLGVYSDLSQFKDIALETADIIVIDECSMIDVATMNRIYELAKPNAKIIFMGDNVQLPPINEDESLTFNAATKSEYNAKLTERMRQSKESPIVPLSDIVAENVERPEKDIERKVIKKRNTEFNPITNVGVIFTGNRNDLMENLERDFKSDIENTKIITYTNDTRSGNRNEMNALVRNMLWGADAKNEYNIGEILVADDNLYESNGKIKITNSEYYKVKSVKPMDNAITIQDSKKQNRTFSGFKLTLEIIGNSDESGKIITVQIPNAASKVEIAAIQSEIDKLNYHDKKEINKNNRNIIPDINYGYTITSHKAQGSTYNNTYVMEDNIVNSGISNKQVNQSLYVAMTRPRNKLVMFSELKEGEFLTEAEKERMESFGISLSPNVEEDWTTESNECGI